MNISDFVANISGGLARTNRFTVLITPPKTVNMEGLMPNQQLLMLCDQVQLPGLNVNTAPVRSYGEVREAPYEFNYEPINIQFYVDTNMDVKIFFDRWIKSIQNGNRRTFNYYKDYICNQMDITVEDLQDKARYMVRLYEVYPKSVSAIQMDYAAKDVMKIQVQLMYKYWDDGKVQDTGKLVNNGVVKPLITIPAPPVIMAPKLPDFSIGNPMGDISNFGMGW
jgi:hypothetical protein